MSATPPRSVVLATRSRGKREELGALFRAAGIAVEDLAEAGVPEDPREALLEVHSTFEANARAKARWFATRLPGQAIVADDSGLEVVALGGAPGVHSKRWPASRANGAALDADNNATLLRALVGKDTRAARYVCVVVCVVVGVDGAHEWTARGHCDGSITEVPAGAAGFGYDPYFFSEELGRTFGEATMLEKASVSHRGRALRALLAQWMPPTHRGVTVDPSHPAD